MVLTDADLDRIDAEANAATRGPWEWSDCFDPEREDCGMVQVRIPTQRAWEREGYHYLFIADMEWADASDLNTANFIATSRTNVPTLVAEIRRLRAALQQIARVEPGLAALPEVAKRVLDEAETE